MTLEMKVNSLYSVSVMTNVKCEGDDYDIGNES